MSENDENWRLARFRNADGLDIAYRDRPESSMPPVLMLHGLTRNSLDFADLAAHLAPRFRTIAMDVRGRGASDRDPDPARYHIGSYVADAFALLDRLGIARAILIGTSMGGLMSMTMGAMAPERISAIVLNDIGPVIEPAGLARIRGYVGPSLPARDWAEAQERMKAINADALPGLDEPAWERFTRRLSIETADGILPAYDPAIASTMQSGEAIPGDLWPLWQALGTIPILALRGEQSDILSSGTLERMKESHPDCTVATIADRGHAPLLDEPDALSAIDGFLKRFL